MTLRNLSDTAKLLLDDSDEARVNHLKRAAFIPHSRASELLEEMEAILTHPKINRMPNMLILARPDNGKTELLREFLARHPAEERRKLDAIYAPVIYIQSPPGPDENFFLDRMLRMLGQEVKKNDNPNTKLNLLLDILPKIETKVILIDEVNALLAGSGTKQRFFLNMLKYMSNDLQISFVAAGTEDARHAVQADSQIKSRFPERILPLWQDGQEFRTLLASFEHILPLKEESFLHKGEVARKLYGMSGGVIGELARVLKSAAQFAIEQKIERITIDVLNNCRSDVRNKSDTI